MIGGEVIGGIALMLGIFTKLAAWLSLPILLGATWMHLGNGWLFSAEGGGGGFPALAGRIGDQCRASGRWQICCRK